MPPSIPDDLLDQLLAGEDAAAALISGGLLPSLKKALAERALNAEMDHHLGQERRDNNSRISVEMVQKSAMSGAPVVVAVSAPTALAIRVAEEAGITLIGIARSDDFEIFTHPERIVQESLAHDA